MKDFETSLNDLLVDTFNSILKYEEKSLKNILRTPVTVGEAHLIEAIGNSSGNATVSDLASSLSVSMPTATVAIKKLEKKGFAQRTHCSEDGRRFRISLTRDGEIVYRTHRLFHKNMVKNVCLGFTGAEKDILIMAIEKLNGFFKGKAIA